jgi:methylated-DNA-[protein]-cysteine S-methyltransferase
MTNYFSYYQSPIGWLALHANEINLLGVEFVEIKSKAIFTNNILQETTKQLDEYFKGERKIFQLPLQLNGTAFQTFVWGELHQIKYGTTLTYMQFAQKLGNPKAIRAIGTTNGKNPFMVLIPCHRVIGANGKLVGYAGGLDKKQWLLDFEARQSGLYLF